jgi:hypothetical protein
MTTIPELPAAVDVSSEAWEAARVDAVLVARASSAAVFLTGLLVNSELETVGRPDRLPADLFPDVDPDVVERVWQRALAVGLHAGRVSAAPRMFRDQMTRVQGLFEAAGFAAMGRAVSRSRRLVAPHPADGEGVRGGASGVTSRTTDTGEGD